MKRKEISTIVLSLVLLGIDATSPRLALAADAEALASEGLRLRREGKDQEALALFQEALRQQPTPRSFAQLGVCEQALGLWVAAESHLLEALKQGQDPWIRKNDAALRESLVFVRRKLGSIEIWGSPAGARVSLDGQVVARLPLAKPVRAAEGRRSLMIEAPGFAPDTRTVNVRAEALSREHVALVPAAVATTPTAPPDADGAPTSPPTAIATAPAPSPPSEPPDAASPEGSKAELPMWRRVLSWSLLAGAVVVGSIGLWQHIDSGKALDRFEAISACGEGQPMRGNDPRCAGLYDKFSSIRTRAYVGYGVAGLLGAGAATFFILNATATSATTDRPHGVAFGPGNAGLSYSILF